MKLHYYYLNCQGFGGGNSLWTHPFYSSIGLIKKNTDLNGLRFAGQMGSVDQAGWHFSYLGGASQIAMKIEAFSHQEFNNEEIKNRDRLERCLKLGIDPFGRGDHDWAFRPIDFYPPKLSAIMRRYPHFVRSNLND
jgi:beta-1,4-mannosyl-glycoprotein beta-1,4-N-acetylglucosaminyltransferase